MPQNPTLVTATVTLPADRLNDLFEVVRRLDPFLGAGDVVSFDEAIYAALGWEPLWGGAREEGGLLRGEFDYVDDDGVRTDDTDQVLTELEAVGLCGDVVWGNADNGEQVTTVHLGN